MATLEIHDDRGRVERVTISRKQPALFGSSPKCEIVLKGPGVLPFHGRIRWKMHRFKVDAAPEAGSIERNGKKVTTASFRIGDEIRVGPFRIFMVNPEEGPLDNKTRIQVPAQAAAGSVFERGSWLKHLQGDQPSVAEIAAELNMSPGDPGFEKALRKALAQRQRQAAIQVPAGPRPPWWKRLQLMLTARDQQPGQERILKSPLVLGLIVTLVVLVVLGIELRKYIKQNIARRQYDTAVESFENGEYRNAIHQFDLFLAHNPKHPNASRAKVLKALANVRQYARGGNPQWDNALKAAEAMYSQVRDEPTFRDESPELAEMVLLTVEGLAGRARDRAEEKTLKEAEEALELHKKIAGNAHKSLYIKSRAPGLLAQARAAVTKGQARTAALAAMDAALKKNSAAGVYAARDQLVAEYPDLATDRDVFKRMTESNALVKAAVKLDTTQRPGVIKPWAEPVGRPTSFVLRQAGAQPATNRPDVIYALAEGFAYGLDGNTGAPLWHIPVGLSVPYPPVPVAGDRPSALIFDARHQELQRIDGRDGHLIWRQALGGPIDDPPLVLGNQIIQTTHAGKLMTLDLLTGALQATLDLGLPLTRTPVADEEGEFFFVMANKANLFIVRRDPLECVSVEYLGHDANAIPCAPARIGNYLIVVENHALHEGRWTVFEISKVEEEVPSKATNSAQKTKGPEKAARSEGEGQKVVVAKLRQLQQLNVPGWTWSSPASSGSVVWALGDQGGPMVFSIGEPKEPLKLLAKESPDLKPSGPSFVRARSEREVWIAGGRSGRFDLDPEKATIAAEWTLNEASPALAPIQVAGRLAIFTAQAEGGGVTLLGVDPAKGSIRWRTILGKPWPLAPVAAPDGNGLTTLGTDGSPLTISKDRLARGSLIEQPLPKPGGFSLPEGPLQRVDMDGLTLIIPEGASQILVREGDGDFRRVDLPAPLAASPLPWGHDLLVPGGDGRVYLIDPRTGASKAEPYVPPFDRNEPIRWRAPARLDGEVVVLADTTGHVRRLGRSQEEKPKLVVLNEVDLKADLKADPTATEAAVFFATEDGQIRALASRDLSPLGKWELEAPRVFGPVIVAGRTFVADATGNVLAFGQDGQRLWTIRLEGATLSGPPILRGDAAWFLSVDGVVQRRALADGKALDRFPLDIVPAGGLIAFGNDVAVPTAPGTVRLLTAIEGPAPPSETQAPAEQ
jgi:outer membrane protein assembly factor BamB